MSWRRTTGAAAARADGRARGLRLGRRRSVAPGPARELVVVGVAATLALAAACGSNSDSEVKPGTGGMSGGSGTGGNAGTGGAGGGGPCAPRTAFTEASHLVLQVTWPAGTATMAGSGQVHLWGKSEMTAAGDTLSGTLQVCGLVLPSTTLAALAGGGMLQIQVPDATWDAATAPRFEIAVTQTGWDVGSTVDYAYTALMGFTLADASTAAWPSSYTALTMTSDPDGDAKPGLTALPRDGGGYVLPPTSILAALGGNRADKLYLVTRHVLSAAFTRTSCDESSGSATLMHLDNHVIGCHVSGGDDCSSTEVNFIDQNRTIYEVTSASGTAKVLADGATCADVRAALPM